MRVLLVGAAMNAGGAETHVVSLARGLSRLGDRVTVVSAGGSLVPLLTREGIAHVTLPVDRPTLPRLLYAFWGLKRLLGVGEFDVVHAHSRISAALLTPLCRAAGVPLAVTAHARFDTSFPKRSLSRWGDRTIAVCEDLRQYLAEEYGLSPLRVAVIPNGVDTDVFAPADTAEERKAHGFRILFASRLDTDCAAGAYALCRVAERLAEEVAGLEIVIAGGGDALPSVARAADRVRKALGRSVVRTVGTCSRLWEEMRRADLVCGVSRVALEAMACGKPVLLVGNEGYGGPLFPARLDEAAQSNFCGRGAGSIRDELLAEDLLRMARLSEERRARLGQALREAVEERYSLFHMVKQTRLVYGEMAREGAKKAGEVVLCGYYGFGNLGDDALLRASIRRARRTEPLGSVSALTAGGRRDEPTFGIRCVKRSRPWAVMREIASARLFVFGGGTLLQDRSSLRSLAYYAALLQYAKRRGVRCQLWGNGLEEPMGPVGEALLRRALAGVERVECRDGASAAVAARMLPSAQAFRVLRVPDLAEGLSASERPRVDFLLRRAFGGPSRPFVVVALRGREGRGHLGLCMEWLAALRGERMELLFVPMFPKEDRAVSLRTCEQLEGRWLEGISEADLVGVMQRSRGVCGMRLHALVLAHAAGVPFVGFGGEEKVHAYCRERGGLYVTDLYS